MRIKWNLCGLLLSSGLLIAPSLAMGGQSDSKTIDPEKSGNSENDVTRKIRQDLTKDKSLSSYARRLKIMAVGNLVLLGGPVGSEGERNAVLAFAQKHAGDNKTGDPTTIP